LRVLYLVFVLSAFLSAKSLKVAVAANVSYAMPEIVKSFHKIYPDIKVEVILGSSGKLYNQIKEGAPFDLFMSANMKYPSALFKAHLAIEPPKVYAKGSLALFSKQKIDFSKGLRVLLTSRVRSIAIANPKIAPYGKAALEAMKNFGIYKKIKNKLTFAQSVSQAAAYAFVATDVGFITKSSLFGKKMKKFKKGINWIEVDQKIYTPIKQGVVILKDSPSARKFYDFLFGKDAKNIFKSYGYEI